ncbi:MAG: hypothetical protein QOC62_1784 [Mycobacterium sp.]|jgi:hypothetical protein|nr:hypothetical protein [Mycobacterium sp.]
MSDGCCGDFQPDDEMLERVLSIRSGIVEALRDVDPELLATMTMEEIVAFSEKAMAAAEEKKERQ